MRIARARGLLPVLLSIGLVAAACGTDDALPSGTPLSVVAADSGGSSTDSSARLAEFESRVRDAITKEQALVAAVTAAATGSAGDVRAVAKDVQTWAADERAWLTEHPADPCYDAATSKLEAAIDSAVSSAGWLASIADASIAPSDDVSIPSAGTEAHNDLQDAARALADAAALAKRARSTCG